MIGSEATYEGANAVLAAVAQCKVLKVLDMHDCLLRGPIPSLHSIASLEELEMAGNELSGPIPPSIGQATHLRRLCLQNNQLDGELPDELGACVRLLGLVAVRRLICSFSETSMTSTCSRGQIQPWEKKIQGATAAEQSRSESKAESRKESRKKIRAD